MDCAGIGALFSHELDNYGVQSHVIQSSALDPFGFGRYYENTSYYHHPNEFIGNAEKIMNDQDWIILHDCPEYIDIFLNCRAKRAVVYHGTRLRNGFKELKIDDCADKIFVTMPDLLKYRPNAILLDRPVDRKLFNDENRNPNLVTKLAINRRRDREEIEGYIRRGFPDVTYRIREDNIVYYGDMPKLLKSYGGYVDIKFDYSYPINIVPEISITGLQALSCGITVYDHIYQPITSFPDKHDSQTSALKFLSELES